MNENCGAKIWRPSVQRIDTNLHHPGGLATTTNPQEPLQLYTKTSLAASPSTYHEYNVQNLNREILSASQSYNNTPKPFSKQRGQSPSLQSLGPILSPVPARSNRLVQQVARGPSLTRSNPEINQDPNDKPGYRRQEETSRQQQQQQRRQQEENMSPKLVHKQYNSPIDLYSMNNIRKTIEAHTELIAPGVKGINFMKPETQVNKQSEVYKLVMEEEHQRDRPESSRLHSVPAQTFVGSQAGAGHHQQEACSSTGQYSCSLADGYEHHERVSEQQNSFNETRQVRVVTMEPPKPGPKGPSCCECGQIIVGPFAKIQNRFVHPHCFNCTTCGTSLKNSGYFTVNDKLYCDIHAKQIAKVMQMQYEFEQKQGKQHDKSQVSASSGHTTVKQQQSTVQQSLLRVPSSYATTSTSNDQHQSSIQSSCNSEASPSSTMFVDRSNNRADTVSNGGQAEVKWTWRPATIKDRPDTNSSLSGCSRSNLLASGSCYQRQQVSSGQHLMSTNGNTTQTGQQQSVVSSGAVGRGFTQEDLYVNGRVPICVHCRVQIQGPYILAGKTTWCKLCSQTNFNCSSCRRSLLDTGFIEDSSHKYYCENCFEAYYAPICSKCDIKIKGDCLNALSKQWHPSCFVCGHCRRPFGNSSFYLEDNVPYCERDWNMLFTTKCYSCSYPIEAGDKWVEALERNYHSTCFRCTSCQANLEGSTFYCKGGKPYCRLHAR